MNLNETTPSEYTCHYYDNIELPEDNEALGAEITLLAAQINAATYRFLKYLAEFDRRKGWGNGSGFKSCAH